VETFKVIQLARQQSWQRYLFTKWACDSSGNIRIRRSWRNI